MGVSKIIPPHLQVGWLSSNTFSHRGQFCALSKKSARAYFYISLQGKRSPLQVNVSNWEYAEIQEWGQEGSVRPPQDRN